MMRAVEQHHPRVYVDNAPRKISLCVSTGWLRGRRDIKQLTQNVAAVEAKLDSTSQVLNQKVELTADEMDRQLEQTVAAVDTKLSKLQNEVRFQTEASEKTTGVEIRMVRSALDQAINTLTGRVDEHEALLGSRSVEDIRDLREKLTVETGSIGEMIDKRLHDTSQRVDTKLENSLKMVQEFTVNFRTEVSGVQESVERMTEGAEKQTAEISAKIAEMKKMLCMQL